MTYRLFPTAPLARPHVGEDGEFREPDYAQLADGSVIAVSTHRFRPDPDEAYEYHLVAHYYAADGSFARTQVLSESASNPGMQPVELVAMAGGGFAVAFKPDGSDNLELRSYDASGALIGSYPVTSPPRSTDNGDRATYSGGGSNTLTALEDGGMALTFSGQHDGILTQYVGAGANFTQVFDAEANPVSTASQISPWVSWLSFQAQVPDSVYVHDSTGLPDGGYVVVMLAGENTPGGVEDARQSVAAQIFNADGTARGAPVAVSTAENHDNFVPHVAPLEDGSFVIAWTYNVAGEGGRAFWRRYDAEGEPLGDAVQVEGEASFAGSGTRQEVIVNPIGDGGFFITGRWGDTWRLLQRYDSEGEPIGGLDDTMRASNEDHFGRIYPGPNKVFDMGEAGWLEIFGSGGWNTEGEESVLLEPGISARMNAPDVLGTADGDRLEAGETSTALFGFQGDDTLIGGPGNDFLVAGAGNDLMRGGPGDDTFYTGPGDNTIEGGAGTDRVIFDGVRASHVTVRGPADNLVITYEGSRTEVTGVEHFEFRLGSFTDDLTLAEVLPLRNSTITGTDDNDTLIGDYGDDLIYGQDGDDLIEGGAGNDRLYGRNGDDTLKGGPGNDMQEGGSGDDLLLGGPGDDTLYGGNGNDTMDGGAGFDQADLRIYTRDVRSVTGPDDALVIESYRGNDVYRNIEEFRFTDTTLTLEEVQALRNLDLTGTSGDDTLTGGYGDDEILGVGGNNLLQGVAGDDTLIGAAGSDTLIGGPGSDALDGGAGNDFLFGDGIEAWHFPDVAAQVYRLYQAVLDRDPDATGHLSWTNRIAVEGMDPLQVTRGFVNSPEFQARFAGLDSEGFVTLLYDNVLGRAPDAQGLARWTNDLDSGVERAAVVRGFSDSPEFRADTAADATAYARANAPSQSVDDVFRLYQATLDRAPDVTGYLNWSDRLGSGTEFLDVVDGFVRSPEFQARFGGQDDAGFVTLLYNNVLERGPDEAGLARWTDDLAQGSTRAEVVRGFSQSPEFRAKTAPDHVAWVRAQGTDDVLIGGPGNDVLAGGRLSDTFVFVPNGGSDQVLDLEVWDNIDLTGFGYANDAEARGQMRQQGEDVLFADFGMEVLFRGTALADITDDMIFV